MQNQKQKILEFLRFQHLIALHIIKHHQHEMLILWSNVKKSWKTLSSKLIEAIRSYIHCMHVCKKKKKKKSLVFFAQHDQYVSILSTYEFKIKIAVSIFVCNDFSLSSTKTIRYNEELCHCRVYNNITTCILFHTYIL